MTNDNITEKFVQSEVWGVSNDDGGRCSGRNDSLFIVTDCELQVTRDNTLFLVITGSIAGQLQDLSCKVLQNSSEVDYK